MRERYKQRRDVLIAGLARRAGGPLAGRHHVRLGALAACLQAPRLQLKPLLLGELR